LDVQRGTPNRPVDFAGGDVAGVTSARAEVELMQSEAKSAARLPQRIHDRALHREPAARSRPSLLTLLFASTCKRPAKVEKVSRCTLPL
jgi:hypothetical protein